MRCSCPRCKAHSVLALCESIFPCSMPGDQMQCGLCVQGSPKKITDDVAALRPTLFIAVPRVLERIQAGIDAKVQLLPDANAQSSRHPCCLPAPMQDQTPAFRHLLACACGLQRHAADAGSAVQCTGSWVAWVVAAGEGQGPGDARHLCAGVPMEAAAHQDGRRRGKREHLFQSPSEHPGVWTSLTV